MNLVVLMWGSFWSRKNLTNPLPAVQFLPFLKNFSSKYLHIDLRQHVRIEKKYIMTNLKMSCGFYYILIKQIMVWRMNWWIYLFNKQVLDLKSQHLRNDIASFWDFFILCYENILEKYCKESKNSYSNWAFFPVTC